MYAYKTAPLGKQRDVIEGTWDKRLHAFLCRPGTGKTKISIDTAGMLYTFTRIGALIVVAPNDDVAQQWFAEQMPTHMPDHVPVIGGVYRSKMGKRAHEQLTRRLRSSDHGLRVLCITFDGLQTPRGRVIAQAVAAAWPSLLVVDESHNAANVTSAAHKAVLRLSKLCRYVRIATGTLVTQNPYATFGQFELLEHGLLGYVTLSAFKSMYSEMLPEYHPLVKRIGAQFKERTGRSIVPQVVARDQQNRPIYRNLRHLRGLLEKWSSFLRLEDVGGTEPRVLLSTRFVELTDEQRRLYDELEKTGVADIDASTTLTAVDALSLGMRLAQITGGFIPSDDNPDAQPIEGGNPKLAELLTFLDELGDSEKVIVWARFKPEMRALAAAIRDRYGEGSTVEYHGDISSADRVIAKRAFIDNKDCRYIVANADAAGTGTDGWQRVANYMAFYSNDYPYQTRDQAIARLARTGGASVVNVVDIVAVNTVDSDIVRCMQVAEDVHATVLHAGMLQRRSPEL